MRLKTWRTVLELNDRKSKLTDTDRIKKITEFIEDLSSKKCYIKPSKEKECSCLSSLHGDVAAQNAISSYIFYWAQKTPFEQQMVLMEKINGVLLAEQLTKKKIISSRQKGGSRPFVVPYFGTNVEETDKKLNSIFICRESLCALYHFGGCKFAHLVRHAKKKTKPVHGNVGKMNVITRNHRENVVPLLQDFFRKAVLPYSGPRPTLFTHNFFTKSVEITPSDGIQELDPRYTKSRLYASFAWDHGWLVKYDPKSQGWDNPLLS